MSVVNKQLDLTMYGCPLHYIKAREAIKQLDMEQEIELLVNNGDSVNEVINSLTQDGQQCEILSTTVLTSTIHVRKKR